VEFRAGHGMRQGNLNGFAIELFGEVDRFLNWSRGFARQADDEIAVHTNADLRQFFMKVRAISTVAPFLMFFRI